jgi:hypothetical protein
MLGHRSNNSNADGSQMLNISGSISHAFKQALLSTADVKRLKKMKKDEMERRSMLIYGREDM